MTDGCWVQFWDDEKCLGATLRFDAANGSLSVPDLDDYTQSDGSKEGDEPDSLVTGTRAWLVVYKDDDFDGTQAMFGPNTKVDDLDAYGVGGNISSFKLYDTRPSWFEESTTGAPTVPVSDSGPVSPDTVNKFFRTVVSAGFALIPRIGGALGALVRGLWPETGTRDEIWGCFQNYLNQVIAGVYWQITYEFLNDNLTNLFEAADLYIKTSEDDPEKKRMTFFNLYTEVNNNQAYYIDTTAPEKRLYFLVPFATLRLATLREEYEHYDYYYGSPPSEGEVARMVADIQSAITEYTTLLSDARTRILQRRDEMIVVEDDDVLIDFYYGKRMSMAEPETLDSRRHYAENVRNQLALKLDEYIAVSQLWPHFDPGVTSPVTPPILNYVAGPMGYFWYGVPDFSQVADADSRITAIKMWTNSDGANPAFQSGLETYIDGVGQGRVGGTNDVTPNHIELTADEVITEVGGRATLRYLQFKANDGEQVSAGDPASGGSDFAYVPLPTLANARMTGVSGSAGLGPTEPAVYAAVKAIAVHWTGELPFDTETVPELAAQRAHAALED